MEKKLKYFPNETLILNDLKKKVVIKTELSIEVEVVKLRWDRIMVILDPKTKMFTCTYSSHNLHVLETCYNPNGLYVLCHNSSNSFLALPGTHVSHVQLVDLASTKLLPMDIPTPKDIPSYIALSLYRTELPSVKGTLTRIICYFIRASNPGTMKMWSSKYLLH